MRAPLIAASAATVLLIAAAPARAQTEPEMPAECDGNTTEIVECLGKRTKVWVGPAAE